MSENAEIVYVVVIRSADNKSVVFGTYVELDNAVRAAEGIIESWADRCVRVCSWSEEEGSDTVAFQDGDCLRFVDEEFTGPLMLGSVDKLVEREAQVAMMVGTYERYL